LRINNNKLGDICKDGGVYGCCACEQLTEASFMQASKIISKIVDSLLEGHPIIAKPKDLFGNFSFVCLVPQ
jgi:hypothetical protein